ncbi:hypothetical protein [Williamsia sp. CHRR-6]|uniref:hypothetical protein n=1 Tax=Williamsia sp. CHRR-6 TaxID=2835871 RepID=UPI001BDA93FC|nr:hypothetical protein [Williamsia sp. CHRR-6]MBT0566638.1 hypothetical protein [Williamsia sp. CHRR-6]
MTSGPDPHQPTPDPTVRQAVVYVATVMGLAVAFIAAGGLIYDTVPLEIVIVFPLIVFAGTVGAGWWTYRTWQAGGRWQVWQGATWFLVAMFLVTLGSTGGALLDA